MQALRARRGRDVSIDKLIESMKTQADRQHRKMGDLIELWTELLPAELVEATALIGLRGGVLSVAADSASVSYELDRRLREGLLAALRSRYRGTLTRVKVQLASRTQPER